MWTSTWSGALGTSNNPYNSWVLHTSTALKSLRLLFLLAVLALAVSTPDAFGQKKVLRLAFRTAETGFDPQRIDDRYSNGINLRTLGSQYFQLARMAAARLEPVALAWREIRTCRRSSSCGSHAPS